MSPKDYSKIWGFIGKYLVAVTLATWATVQGAPGLFGINAADKYSLIAALFGIVICAPLLVVMGYVGAQYAKSIDHKTWAGRIPVVGLSEIDFRSRDGKLFQGFFLIAYVLVPAGGLVHFVRTLLMASVFTRQGRTPIGHFSIAHLDWTLGDQVRVGEGEGVTYFPVIEPLFLLSVCVIAWISALYFAWMIFTRSNREAKS
jgi:hypothetical protein